MQNNSFREEIGKVSLKRIASFFRKRTYLVAFLFCLPVGAIYFSCAVRITPNVFAPTGRGYYTYLLDAFFHGRTNVLFPANQLDLSWFENKWYLYWGPAPVLLILPFYLVSHLQASDILYTVIGGTVNVALFSGVMQEFKKCFQISLSLMAEAFLAFSFGLASPNFFLSVDSGTPYTNQIFAVTYLLLFYLFYVRFLNKEKPSQLILCTVFFCLACLSRYTLVFHGMLFVYLFVHGKRSGRAIPTKIILYVALIMFTFCSLDALYNFVRFHDVLETGLRFQQGPARYTALLERNHILSIRYFLHNAYYCFINMITIRFSPRNMLVIIDIEGNSIFCAYPALLLIPLLFYTKKDVNKKRMSFLILAGMVIVINVLVFLLYFSTGWFQFGYRYLSDVLPLIFILLMFILPSIPVSIQIGLLAYGIFVNFYGIMAFYHLPTDNSQLQVALFWIVLLTSFLAFLSTERKV